MGWGQDATTTGTTITTTRLVLYGVLVFITDAAGAKALSDAVADEGGQKDELENLFQNVIGQNIVGFKSDA